MRNYLARRLLTGVALLWFVATLTFLLLHAAPGSPVDLFSDPRIPREQIDKLSAQFGLDRPLHVQYFAWLKNLIVGGNWGMSFFHLEPPQQVISRTFPATALLAIAASLIGYLLGTCAGAWAAVRPNSWADRALRITSLGVYSLPTFWLGLMLILIFSGALGILPASGMHSPFSEDLPILTRWLDTLAHLILPAVTLGLPLATVIARLLRGALLDVLEQDFIRTARSRGISERRILFRHAMKNCLGPLVHTAGLMLPSLLGGALLVEYVFSWPGLGSATVQAISSRDYPLVLATTIYTGALVILGNLVADIAHAWIDPRVRDGEFA